MASERDEIFWAIANVQSFMDALRRERLQSGSIGPTLEQILKDWQTCYCVILDKYDSEENALEAEAQASVDILLETLKIEKSP